jgi:uncharacterized protein (DUF2267 family)
MSIHFDKFASDGNAFIKDLCMRFNYPDRRKQASIIIKAVLHTLRDSITIQESLDVLAQLPMFLKAVYVENWKYREKPKRHRTIEDFTRAVEEEQRAYGETRFDWHISTEEIVRTVFDALGKYVSEGEFEDIAAELPGPVKDLVQVKIR